MRQFITTILLSLSFWSLAIAPDWSVKPEDFNNSMVVVGVLNLGGSESMDSNDIIAAFIDGEVRGVASLQYESSVDRYIAYMLIYHNGSSGNVTFSSYDTDGDEIVALANTMNFTINQVAGNVLEPIILSDQTFSNDAIMTSFTFSEQVAPAIINNGLVSIEVAFGTDLTSLIASFTTSAGASTYMASAVQISGVTANDFSDSRVYRVESESGAVSTDYTVVVSESAEPFSISLSANEVEENGSTNLAVGAIETNISNASFELVSGTGDTDNSSFYLTENVLITSEKFDFELKSSYSVRIRAYSDLDQVIAPFDILITDGNESPTISSALPDIDLGNVDVTINLGEYFVDPDADDILNFIVLELGKETLSEEIIYNGSDKSLTISKSLSTSTYVEITAEDNGGLSASQFFKISVPKVDSTPPTVLNNGSELLYFSFSEQIGSATIIDGRVEIEVVSGTDLTSLVADFYLSEGAKVFVQDSIQNSGITSNDFSNSLTYLVVSESMEDSTQYGVNVKLSETEYSISLTSNTINENETDTVVIGSVESNIQNALIEFVSGDGDTDNSSFYLTENVLITSEKFDFESKSRYSVRIRAYSGLDQVIAPFDILITDGNESPTISSELPDINLGNVDVTINLGEYFVDPDADDILNFSVLEFGKETPSEEIIYNGSDKSLTISKSLSTSTYVEVTAEDNGGLSASQFFKISVPKVDSTPPTVLNNGSELLYFSFSEQIGSATIIDGGVEIEVVSGTDLTSLVADFYLSEGAKVFVQDSIQNSGITSNDFSNSLTYLVVSESMEDSTQYGVNVKLSETEYSISLTSNAINENEADTVVIGSVESNIQNALIEFVSGDGDTDNELFNLFGNELRADTSFNYETKSSYSVRISASSGDQKIESSFSISIHDINEAPTDILLTNSSIVENNIEGTYIGSLIVEDPDGEDSYSLELAAPSLFFNVTPDGLLTSDWTHDFETTSEFDLEVVSTDASGLTFSKTFTIKVVDENEPPKIKQTLEELVISNQPVDISLNDYFSDPDGDDLNYLINVIGESTIPDGIIHSLSDQSIQFTEELDNSYFLEVSAVDKEGLRATQYIQLIRQIILGYIDDQEVRIFPNPTTDFLHVESSSRELGFQIRDQRGIMVMNGTEMDKIDVRHFKPGLYYFQINETKKVWKFLKGN